MTGPTTKRLPATEPSLQQPSLDLLKGIFGGGGNVQQNFSQRFGFGGNPQIMDAFANFLQQPTAEQRTNAASLSMQGGLGSASGIPGFDVLASAGPVFQRNLTEAMQRQQQSGPRFASTNANQQRLLQQQSLQDFNAFAAQTLEAAQGRQLQGILGAAQASQGQQQIQANLLGPLLAALFQGGLSSGIAVGPSPFSQAVSGAAGIGALAVGMKGPQRPGNPALPTPAIQRNNFPFTNGVDPISGGGSFG